MDKAGESQNKWKHPLFQNETSKSQTSTFPTTENKQKNQARLGCRLTWGPCVGQSSAKEMYDKDSQLDMSLYVADKYTYIQLGKYFN